jgi:urease accessory protein UreH
MPSLAGSAATCSSKSSCSGRSGRDGLLRLGFERSARAQSSASASAPARESATNCATLLRHCRYTLPLQVLAPLTLDDGTSYLLLLNPTGGVLGGDRLRTEITLAENASVCLSTPSATRIYRTTGAPAEIHTTLRLGRGATMEYLPDHIVPHAGSRLRQSLCIEMEPGSRGIFFDAFSAGRVTQNELWRFLEFDSRTEITLAGKLLYASRAKLNPAHPPAASHSPLATSHSPLATRHSLPSVPPCHQPSTIHPPLPEKNLPPFRGSELQLRHHSTSAAGALAPEEPDSSRVSAHPAADALHCLPPYSASLVIVADQFSNWRASVESLRAELADVPGITGGVSLLTECGCSARYLASSAIALNEATRRLWTTARREIFNLPPLDLRKY